ncbi:hypothetical protein EQP59_07135 [Ornithobacterium rhinotracheale]|uniref:Uncharacterized protein n=1 Tax=Ornithobacterium rhinotracheale TaxID=28251 RepID=A0A410JSY1_ORNRH|nr:hypothetical protein [Ornithobacterium rhinotracheale]QAR31119.1 hypothetical protein EQP59_07135 [Ornithobacterium rhinotracheale]
MVLSFFTIIGCLLLAYGLMIVLGFIFKATAFISLLGLAFLVKGGQVSASQWWAAAIQLPFLLLEFALIFTEGWGGLAWALLVQVLVSVIIFNLQRIKANRH